MSTNKQKIQFDFAQTLLDWFDGHGRKSLPWQNNKDPYAIWVSEIMLQQTQVDTVIPYYQNFIARFPNIESLANSKQEDVLAYWAGLGYYARGRNLYRGAQLILDQHKGVFPTTLESVMSIPGIGRSTAGAILAFSANQRHPILDGNVKRVLTRFFALSGYPGKKDVENELWGYAENLTPNQRVADYTQGIMDLGATVCVRGNPLCTKCPLADNCQALKRGAQKLFPEPKPKTIRPIRQCRMLVINNHRKEVLLVKRPPTGIWGGLWVFPEITDTKVDPRPWCGQNLNLGIDSPIILGMVKHGFTHFELEITPIQCRLDTKEDRILDGDSFLWYNQNSNTAVAIPAAVKKILKLI